MRNDDGDDSDDDDADKGDDCIGYWWWATRQAADSPTQIFHCMMRMMMVMVMMAMVLMTMVMIVKMMILMVIRTGFFKNLALPKLIKPVNHKNFHENYENTFFFFIFLLNQLDFPMISFASG